MAVGESETTVRDVPMDAAMRLSFVQWVYREWARAVDVHEQARERRYDPRTDGDKASYRAFYEEGLADAKTDLVKWTDRLERYKHFSPLLGG